jgi:hypothetical protein
VVRGTLLQSLLQNHSFFGTLSKAKLHYFHFGTLSKAKSKPFLFGNAEQSEEQTIPFWER